MLAQTTAARERARASLPIEVTGRDARGRPFVERAQTVVISPHGAWIRLRRKLTLNQRVTLHVHYVGSKRRVAARILARQNAPVDSYQYAVAFLDGVNPWNVVFAPAESQPGVTCVLLECPGCTRREVAFLNAVETELLLGSGGLRRPCPVCQESVVWRRGMEAGGSDRAPAGAPAVLAAPPGNRRRRARARLSLLACVRTPGGAGELVSCEDLSRDGLSFKSRRRYRGSRVEVAVPYGLDAANIFLPARVVSIVELKSEGALRYGLSYLRPAKK